MTPPAEKETVLFLRTDPAIFDPRILKETTSLSRAGYVVAVFGWDRSGEHPRDEILGSVRYRRCRIRAPYGSKRLLFYLPLFWISAVREIGKVRPGVIHACDLDALVPALLGKWFFRSKVVYDIFDHFADKLTGIPDILRSALRRIDGWLAGRVDYLIVTDERRLGLLSALPACPVGIIMNVPLKNPRGRAPRSGGGTVKVCYAGVIHEHRGLHLIARAIEDIDRIETIFAGWIPRPVDRDFLLAQKKISYIGKLPYADAMKLLEDCDILLGLYDPTIPINRVASSNKVYEAMSSGIPVISNRETSMAEVIAEVSCGALVTYGDPGELERTIAYLRDNPGIRGEMGERGRRAHLERFNWDIMEERLLGYYEALCCGRSRGDV